LDVATAVISGIKTNTMDQLITFIQDLFQNPPGAYNPANQTLKGWVVFCLRDRGLLVDNSVNGADLRVRSKVGEAKFKVSSRELFNADTMVIDPNVGWIVVDPSGKSAEIIPPSASLSA
jgi:hypothetical protein